MVRSPRIVAVDHLGGLRLRATFNDGLVRELDFAGRLDRGVLAPLADPVLFARARVDQVAGTVCWPRGLDLDPDVLHGDAVAADGQQPRLIREYRLRPTG